VLQRCCEQKHPALKTDGRDNATDCGSYVVRSRVAEKHEVLDDLGLEFTEADFDRFGQLDPVELPQPPPLC
jgi:hypothetical protein